MTTSTIDTTSTAGTSEFARAEERKIHTTLVLGQRDLEAGAVSVRLHGKGPKGTHTRAAVFAKITEAIRTRGELAMDTPPAQA